MKSKKKNVHHKVPLPGLGRPGRGWMDTCLRVAWVTGLPQKKLFRELVFRNFHVRDALIAASGPVDG